MSIMTNFLRTEENSTSKRYWGLFRISENIANTRSQESLEKHQGHKRSLNVTLTRIRIIKKLHYDTLKNTTKSHPKCSLTILLSFSLLSVSIRTILFYFLIILYLFSTRVGLWYRSWTIQRNTVSTSTCREYWRNILHW